jgi:hypothetical protein
MVVNEFDYVVALEPTRSIPPTPKLDVGDEGLNPCGMVLHPGYVHAEHGGDLACAQKVVRCLAKKGETFATHRLLYREGFGLADAGGYLKAHIRKYRLVTPDGEY